MAVESFFVNTSWRGKMKALNIFITLLAFAILASCTRPEDKQAGPTQSTSSALFAAIATGKTTLLSNFNPNHQYDFTLESLVDSENELAFFDFDRGEITNADSADIYLSVSCGTSCFNDILDINGAKSVELGGTEPGLDGCLEALQEDRLRASIVPGTYSCIRTTEGNIVQILAVENEAHSRNSQFTFEYVIWYRNR